MPLRWRAQHSDPADSWSFRDRNAVKSAAGSDDEWRLTAACLHTIAIKTHGSDSSSTASSSIRCSTCFCFCVCGNGMYSPLETIRVGTRRLERLLLCGRAASELLIAQPGILFARAWRLRRLVIVV